jgi:hypothetical protein
MLLPVPCGAFLAAAAVDSKFGHRFIVLVLLLHGCITALRMCVYVQHSVGGGGGCSALLGGTDLSCSHHSDADSNSDLRAMASAVQASAAQCSGQLLLCMQGGGGGGISVAMPPCQYGAGFSFSFAQDARNPSTPATCPSDPQSAAMATIVQQCNSKCEGSVSYNGCYCPCTSTCAVTATVAVPCSVVSMLAVPYSLAGCGTTSESCGCHVTHARACHCAVSHLGIQ